MPGVLVLNTSQLAVAVPAFVAEVSVNRVLS